MLDSTHCLVVASSIADSNRTHVVHLSGIADPQATWNMNVHAKVGLANIIVKQEPDCWLIHFGAGMMR